MSFLRNKFVPIMALTFVAILALKTGDLAAAEEVAKSFNPEEMKQYADMASKEAGDVTGGFFLTDAMLAVSIAALAAAVYLAFG